MIVDIHNHILPGFDDGARDISEALQMGRQAEENGITHIIATPHHRNGTYSCEPTEILKSIDEVNALFKSEAVNVEVLPGMEIHLYGDIVKDLGIDNKELLSLNNRKYVLIELPYTHIPHFTGEILYQMQLSNHIPIIAHPERNAEIKRRPNLLVDLVHKGALAQITAASIIGKFGKESQRFSLRLLKHRLVHFIASDAHNTKSRSFQLFLAYKYIERHFSTAYAEYLISNSTHVIKGTEFMTPLPIPFERKKKYSIFQSHR